MKITVDINGVPTEIELTSKQVASIEAQNKPKFKWEYNAPYLIEGYAIRNYSDSIKDGHYRRTKEVAEQSLARNKRANRLEALAEQLGGLREFSHGQINCFIYKNGVWTHGYNTFDNSPDIVYMTKECATEISRMLNAGEFSLDGELE